MSILSVCDLSVEAWGASLLKDVNLQVNSGEIAAIIGPNGAGKSTLLNTICDTIQPSSGKVLICDQEFGQWPKNQLAKHLAVLPQQNLLNFPFTVQEVIGLGRIPHASGCAVDNKIVDDLAQMLDITHLLKRLYTRLSGGEKQRTQLARVLAQIWRKEDADQRLLLLDEPTGALDLGHQRQLMRLISEFTVQGVAVVMVMHDIDLAANYANQMVALNCGRVVSQGPVDQVVVPKVLTTLFGVEIDVLEHPKTGRPILLKT